MFVDRVTLQARGGDGGDGVVSFRREKYVPRGGPDGGDGGHGGHVIVRAVESVTNLSHLSHQRHWAAQRGEHGQGKNCTGRSANPSYIDVPVGTLVFDRDRGFLLRDLKTPGEEVVIARGGRGGHGNTHFKSSTDQAPRRRERGGLGEERWITLELKVIADVGLIGLPNAGKSTLLSRISHAHPEIANYPFTTKYPNLGSVDRGDDTSIIVADIPGLIEGAHAGHGLGHEFLRHVERTRLLVHLLEAVPLDESDPVANYRVIREELRLYSEALAVRPEIVVVSKIDLTGADDAVARVRQQLGVEVFPISAVTGRGIPQLLGRIATRLDEIKAAEPDDAAPTHETPPTPNPAPEDLTCASSPG